MSGFYFIVQASKFLLIDATAVNFDQGHGEVIQYISPDLYILCPKYLRFSSNGFDVKGNFKCNLVAADAVETNWKHKVIPDRGELISKYMMTVVCQESVWGMVYYLYALYIAQSVHWLAYDISPSLLGHIKE